MAKLRIVHPGEPYGRFVAHNHYELVLECPSCGEISSMWALGALFWFHAAPQAFAERYPYWVTEQEVVMEYANQPALRFRLFDLASSARLIILAHSQTLQIFTTIWE